MWYAGDNHTAGNAGLSICHATSLDGISWAKDSNNPVLTVGSNGTWDDQWVTAPGVVFDGNLYHMWYCAWDGDSPGAVRIGHATSPHPDGAWTKDVNNPVLDCGTSTCWDTRRVDAPDVIFDGSRFHMFYSGGLTYRWQIGYAWSPDGGNWTKYDNPGTPSQPYGMSDPVLYWGLPGTMDDLSVSHCSTILDPANDSLQLWYTAADTLASTQIALATAKFDTSMISGIKCLLQPFPLTHALHQNYPNPFNPTTVISWQLAVGCPVNLAIYNTTGQKVAELVNEIQPAGKYMIQFNAEDLPSGIYFYRLEAGTVVKTRKMILVK